MRPSLGFFSVCRLASNWFVELDSAVRVWLGSFGTLGAQPKTSDLGRAHPEEPSADIALDG